MRNTTDRSFTDYLQATKAVSEKIDATVNTFLKMESVKVSATKAELEKVECMV